MRWTFNWGHPFEGVPLIGGTLMEGLEKGKDSPKARLIGHLCPPPLVMSLLVEKEMMIQCPKLRIIWGAELSPNEGA